MVTSFGILDLVFSDLFYSSRWSLGLSQRISPATTVKRILFDDDDEALAATEDRWANPFYQIVHCIHPCNARTVNIPTDNMHRASASRFLMELKPFLSRIDMLRHQTKNLRLTNRPERIRVAILDSGVDDTDPMIRPAIKFGRINQEKSKSFVSQRPEEWRSDTYGHGTHVTRLVLQTAPAAEVYVGKICTGKMINDEFMPGIAKVRFYVLLLHSNRSKPWKCCVC